MSMFQPGAPAASPALQPDSATNPAPPQPPQPVAAPSPLEPMQAGPTIIEDNCFIGARSEVVEGVVVEENSVLGMGVYLGQSTPIFNRATGEISYGRVPSGSVVVSGNLPKTAANGAPYSMYAAIIVKQVDAQTRSKTSINDLLRD